jgi:SAM-dependent methyltransferase
MPKSRKVNIGRIITTDKEMRPRQEQDYYPTPDWLIHTTLIRTAIAVQPSNTFYILDPGAGKGEWGKFIKLQYPMAYLIGVDPNHAPEQGSIEAASYDKWISDDYLEILPDYVFDLVIGNPPYILAEEFVRHSMTLLKPGGSVVFLLRLAFLEGQARGESFWRKYPLHDLPICSKRPSFTGNGKTDATAYAVYHWIKGDKNPLYLSFITG